MRVIYLTQGDGKDPGYDYPAGSDHLYLQWQPEYQPRDHSFHFPDSSWAAGRNELYRRAVDQGPYDYYIFLDDDVSFDHGDNAALIHRRLRIYRRRLKFALYKQLSQSGILEPFSLQEFEQLLEANGTVVGAPRLWLHDWYQDTSWRPVDAVAYLDMQMIAVHHTAASKLLPYTTEFDDIDWWLSGEFFMERATKLFWGKVHRFSNRLMWNREHRDYPQGYFGRRPLPVNQIGEPDLSPLPLLDNRH